MHRNLDRRVEALVRLDNPAHIAETSELFDLAMDPGTSAWHLEPDGDWVRHDRDAAGEPLVDLQDERWRQVSSRRRPVGTR
jgi:polyphosphate kinase